MSFALTLGTLITPLILAAPPAPCPSGPAGRVPAPVAIVEGSLPECPPLGGEAAADALRYAELEAKTPAKVTEFRGGSVAIYIGTTAAVIILVVVLLVIFL